VLRLKSVWVYELLNVCLVCFWMWCMFVLIGNMLWLNVKLLMVLVVYGLMLGNFVRLLG